ncbi:MAG: aminotransferase class III-fold pyridoxal phosphate-dependent enzyme [Acidobacteria bacterium]|jgi:glutamate-1-semialdehyde 2,1-aminomutase|nr:aminotransferase class III-fold pyridoxal phosphate-dependent enzyme [Acidobacteriota bacterium]
MGQRSEEILTRASALPEMRARVEHHPLAHKAEGARIYDVDNHGYIDYTGAGGAAIVGYANQFILDAVRKVLAAGVPDGLHVPLEVDVAEGLEQFVPWASTWAFVRHHDEALRTVLRWLRRQTGKSSFLLLDGGGHGIVDEHEVAGTSRSGFVREVPGWDLARIEAAVTGGASKVAALVLDPLLTRFGVVEPPAGALAEIAGICAEAGVLLVFDEGISGFRVHRGGAATLYDVTPDVAVYGRALGGGFPIGAIAVREGVDTGELVRDESLPVPHPVSLAAAEAVLSILKNDSVYDRLEERTRQLEEGILALAERFSRPLTFSRVGSAFAVAVGREPVVDKASWEATDADAYRRFANGLLEEGVLIPSVPCGTAFLSNAHGVKEVEETLAACERVLLKLHQEDMP